MKPSYYLLIAFVVASSVGQAQSITLYYDGITTGLKKPKDEIALTSVSGGFSTFGNNVNPQDYSVTKIYDETSVRILDNLVNNTLGQTAEIRFYNTQNALVKTIKLEETKITAYAAGGTPCDSCPVVSENLSISFQKIKITDHGTNQVFSWNAPTTPQ